MCFFLPEDAHSKLSKMLYDPEWTLKDREHYLTEVIPMWLGHFEKIAPALATQVILDVKNGYQRSFLQLTIG